MVNLHEDVAAGLQALPVTDRHFRPRIVWSEPNGNRRRHVWQPSFSPVKFKKLPRRIAVDELVPTPD
jgi:hypothetical protein